MLSYGKADVRNASHLALSNPLSKCAESTSSDLATSKLHTIIDALAFRARSIPDQTAFVHLVDGEVIEQAITYRELWSRSQSIAAYLKAFEPNGKRAVLLLDTGIEYVSWLFGLFHAGMTIIPAFPPIGSRGLSRLALICADAQPDIIVADARFSNARERLNDLLPSAMPQPYWVETTIPTGGPDCTGVGPARDDIALLQYTSGSTSTPKGVILTHANLVSNCENASLWMGDIRGRVGCTWLPPYHDMGLMGGILQPVYDGFSTLLINPGHFIQKPFRWLSAVSRYKVTVTIAPNFALDLCTDGISDAERSTLDLRHVRAIYCGAEPVRSRTIERFTDRFAAAGLDPATIGPCYGLAEATVLVAGKPVDKPFVSFHVDREMLSRGTIQVVDENAPGACPLVSSGRPAAGVEILIVDPLELQIVPEGRIGEIWVKGDNVGTGYWRNAVASSETFGGTLPEVDGQFLRTGDLGALLEGELIVTGRLKDLIIVSGRNLYPQDIELTVEETDSRIRPNGCVAVALDDGERERIAIVAEIKRSEKLDDVAQELLRRSLTAAIVAAYGVKPEHIHLATPGTIPRTTSGKVRRRAVRDALLAGNFAQYGGRTRAPVPADRSAS
ncbi:fatty acyl-AMP ligase [Sphingomonas sp. SORGH_AS_0789]|nr:fatty acyl-AMP ligase [Sphingomonas sp. SORGH_AS_0789]MDR6116516.1 acyl-CoA synthetase (AMP-forming)/AMP-acid ligase II [Sphingomonas sp. SORGH_AS_0789]MDR6149809.1 acyl-CoA synthetase (AMP-forming)/AMP-acid ligase II [Sphingomonas sp. SORGH_AS_0742]